MSGGWLEDFVKSLGHRIMYSMPRGQGIQEVHSKTPPRGKTIRGNPKHSRETYWWTLDRDYLDQMSKEEFYDLHMAIFDSKAYRKIVFLTNPSTSAKTAGTTSQTLRKIVLSAVSDCTVHDLPGPAIILPKMTLGRRSSVPPPVPFLRPPEIEPWNEIEDPIISHIPWTGGQGPWGCPYVILVEPEVDCAEAAKRGFSWKLPAEMAPAEYRDKRDGFMSPWADEKELAWNEAALALSQVLVRPKMYPTDLEVKQAIKDHYEAKAKLRVSSKDVLESMGECYCRILKEAVNWADHCLRATEGQRGGVIIVRISPHGLKLGLPDRPCYKEFEKAFRKLNDVWKKKGYGAALIEDFWGVGWL